jgi:hypothetical protein
MVATQDGSPRSRHRMLAAARACWRRSAPLIPTRRAAISFRTRRPTLERDLALGSASRSTAPTRGLLPFGTKTGCRRLFAESGVLHPLGHEDVHDVDGVAGALAAMRAARPAMGVGDRQAQRGRRRPRQRRGRPPRPARPGRPDEADALRGASRRWRSSTPETRLGLPRALAADGGIVEERVGGAEVRSPSVQLRVTPLGEVELLSTHDQVARRAQRRRRYLGCRFPADFGYARRSPARPAKVGERLARGGRARPLRVDFVVVRDARGAWTPYAIELNLRKGGTTHPFLTLQFLTDGTLRPDDRALHRAERAREAPVATDHLESELFRTAHDRRPVRHRRPAPAALRPGAPGGGRLPHAQRVVRARERRVDRGRRQPGGRGCAVPPGGADPPRGGRAGPEPPLPEVCGGGALQADRVARPSTGRRCRARSLGRTPARALEAARVPCRARVEPQPGDHA